jgi:hypothetical protein
MVLSITTGRFMETQVYSLRMHPRCQLLLGHLRHLRSQPGLITLRMAWRIEQLEFWGNHFRPKRNR